MKTGVVGSGFVGATAAYALVMRGVGRRLVLVDQNRARAEAEAPWYACGIARSRGSANGSVCAVVKVSCRPKPVMRLPAPTLAGSRR